MKIKETLKTKTFWGGVLTTIGAVLTGAMAIPQGIIELIKLIGIGG